MSFNKKLDDAYERGVLTERGRILWLMDDERIQLRQGLMKVILVEQQRHILQTKIRLAVAIFEKLKMRMMAGDEPPKKPKEKGNGEVEDPLDEGAAEK